MVAGEKTGNRAVSNRWLMFAATCGLVAALLAWRESYIERAVPAGAKRA